MFKCNGTLHEYDLPSALRKSLNDGKPIQMNMRWIPLSKREHYEKFQGWMAVLVERD